MSTCEPESDYQPRMATVRCNRHRFGASVGHDGSATGSARAVLSLADAWEQHVLYGSGDPVTTTLESDPMTTSNYNEGRECTSAACDYDEPHTHGPGCTGACPCGLSLRRAAAQERRVIDEMKREAIREVREGKMFGRKILQPRTITDAGRNPAQREEAPMATEIGNTPQQASDPLDLSRVSEYHGADATVGQWATLDPDDLHAQIHRRPLGESLKLIELAEQVNAEASDRIHRAQMLIAQVQAIVSDSVGRDKPTADDSTLTSPRAGRGY